MSKDLPSIDTCLIALTASGALKLKPIEPEKPGVLRDPQMEVIAQNVMLLADVRRYLRICLQQLDDDKDPIAELIASR